MKRRNAVELIVIGAAAPLEAQEVQLNQHQHAPTTAAVPAKTIFTPAQHALVDTLAEMIIPADKRSGGAREAKVADFIDDFVATSAPSVQNAWTSGIAAVEDEAKRRFGKKFVDCTSDNRDQILKDMAAGEESPTTPLHRFFINIKRQTMSGYYTSSIGLLKDLQYKGIVPIAFYPACEHPDHQKVSK